jgi:hypothetical protein
LADNELLEMYKQHRSSQDKYVYFLMAIVSSAIAFTVNKTTNIKVSFFELPLLLAVISWGVSFFFGCKYLTCAQMTIAQNYDVLQLKQGVHPKQPSDNQKTINVIKGLNEKLNEQSINTGWYLTNQFRLTVTGALFFLTWHALKVYQFTTAI